uniref:Ig-like domain-containing protein n=2 Tax=unclassified Enterobacter TaxID=2608935 RepID=UPI001C54111F|nr:Ig-like domain-containing protein [Enterobacter sp. Sphag71]
MPDGDYSVSIAIKDRAGNVGKPTLRTLRIDTTPPEAPVLINLYDDQGTEQRSFDPGSTTDDKRPTLTGVAQKGTTVYLLNDKDEKIGSAVADKTTGVWKMEPTQDLEDGTNALRLVAEEKFDGVTRAGAPSEAFNIIIGSDGLPPNTITITEAFDDAGSTTGALANGALTDDTTPTLSGTASAGSTVIVYYRLAGSNTWAGSATATVTGESWTWMPGSALPVGSYEFQASIGANSSALFSLEIATAEDIGLRTRIESAYDDFGLDQGPLADGAITDDATPTLRGRGEANGNVIIRYMLEGGSAASVVVNADSAGNWRWTPGAELATGVWSFDVQAQGRSSWSNGFKLEITGSGENSYAPVIDYAFDDVGASTGKRSSGATTDDTTPTLNGKAAANSVVYLQAINGADVKIFSVQADSSSNWQWTPPAELATGDWNFHVSNNASSGWGDRFDLTIVTPQPSTPGKYSYNFENFSSLPGLEIGTKLEVNKEYEFSQDLTIKSLKGESFVTGSPTNYIPYIGNKSLIIRDKAGISINFNGAESFSWQAMGTNGGAAFMIIYDITGAKIGEEIATLLTNGNTPSNYSYKTSGDLIGWVDIWVGDNGGINFDNIAWEIPSITSGINQHDEITETEVFNSDIDSHIINPKNQILKISVEDILQHGKDEIFITNGSTQTMIQGSEGDVVQLVDILPEGSDISEWTLQDGTVTVAGVEYEVYSHGDDAELLVQQGVKTELV